MNLAEGKMFVRNADNIIEVFGEAEFEAALENFDLKDFTTKEYVPLDNAGMLRYYTERMGYPILGDARHFIREEHYCKGQVWERYVDKPCREFLVPDRYQFSERKLLHAMLAAKLPYFDHFKWKIYHLDRPDDDIYLECESGSLYVPVKALLAADWQMILDRHCGYFKSYYNRPGSEEHLAKALSIPLSYAARLLRACMEVPI